ncbi:BolA family protein [Marinobacter zhejiangensis]|uniref:BolA protein n=1 Tax=Marinobacter zhejiangensis TaxID=488535 RepID=A0A1I4QSY4_9GAMM|nr:BolA/IbaG family iron-sulfur metabolism protein [Marinobacter zhejiangensis]SFM43178.1 BolA protein [Marinobacter zhejiangensis]
MSVQNTIEQKLGSGFRVEFLQVENESHRHSVPPNSETHFKVTLVSGDFEGQGKVKRHQAIYRVLAEELAGEVHALALHLYTPEEWSAVGAAPASPNCMGGSKHDPALKG